MKLDLRPMLATLIDDPFNNPEWIFETKWDGYRLMAEIEKDRVRLFSRNLIDKSSKYPTICDALRGLGRLAVIDGELVALDAKGRSRFQLLQNAERETVRLRYCAFDLLYLDDEDLRDRPLVERKEMLERILPQDSLLHYSSYIWDKGIPAFKRAGRAREEGIMAKLASSHYFSGKRTRDWLKVKSSLGQEVVIVGFTAPRRSRQHIGSLLLAVREDRHWRYVGRVGAGLDRAMLKSLHAMLVPLITETKPVEAKVPAEVNTTWVRPKLVCEVKFTEWTAKGEMRHPVFLGLRTDKKATDVVREKPTLGADH
ncbi:MAG: non-homologous end-joining DNA ligase [Methyloceanibacter sp.]|jgi:bifunctional non-homologous end joining protein LigD